MLDEATRREKCILVLTEKYLPQLAAMIDMMKGENAVFVSIVQLRNDPSKEQLQDFRKCR